MKNEKWKIDFKRRDTETQRLFEHGKHEINEKTLYIEEINVSINVLINVQINVLWKKSLMAKTLIRTQI